VPSPEKFLRIAAGGHEPAEAFTITVIRIIILAMESLTNDTSPEAEDVLFARLRSMDPGSKLLRVSKLSKFARTMTLTGIVRDFPGIGERELRYHFAVRTIGKELADRYFGVER
jgi:hypothetical protein